MSPHDKEVWRQRWNGALAHIQSMPPLLIAFVLLIVINIPISILSVKFGVVNKAEQELIRQTIQRDGLRDLIYYRVIFSPISETIWYLGIARIIIFLLPPVTNLRKIFAWMAILAPTFFWAFIDGGGGHAIPFDALWGGILFGWVMIETRSLESVIALHMAYNAINLAGALIRYRLI